MYLTLYSMKDVDEFKYILVFKIEQLKVSEQLSVVTRKATFRL